MVNTLKLTQIGKYTTGVFDESAAEIPAYDPDTQRLFVVNANSAAVDVLDLSDPSEPTLIKAIDVSEFGEVANSVAVQNGIVAVAVEAAIAQNPGRVVFLNTDGDLLSQVEVGALPDMLTFTPDGTKVLVANEGEPSDDYTDDPEGSVSIIDLSDGVANLSNADVSMASFSAFNEQKAELIEQGVRIFGPDVSTADPNDTVSVAQDLEPEYIAVTSDSATAYVALQENNALAKVEISASQVTEILPLGFKNHLAEDNALDASDDEAIAIRNAPVLGMYQPDGIAAYEADDGKTYIVTANEGDAREYIVEDDQGNESETFVEEARVEDLTLDPEAFPDADNLGRLTVTTTLGDTNGDGEYEQLYAFGGRSFSIFDTEGNLVFDSGSDFERITAEQVPDFFNSDNDENTFDTRSDNKGPEPEGVVLGEVNGRNYAFVGLERVGGVMVYDITEPTEAEFVQYINTRDFSGDPEAGTAGDLGPEGLSFIRAEDSPNGNPLLAVAYEVSGSTAIFDITALTPIYDIQGAGHRSPFTDEPITTQGIVTAVDDNGFYLQDPQGDGDLATSDGILVFTGGTPEYGEGEAVAVGDEVQVAGKVSEFVPGGSDTGNLSTTEITAPTLTKLSQNNELPDAVVLGVDRTPPTQVIDDDGLASYDPTEDGIDFYESLEGMLVTANDALAVSPTNRFGEIYTVANNGEDATGLSRRGTLNISPNDFNPERIQIQFDDGIFPVEAIQVDVGAQLGDVTGVVGYSFGNYEVNVTEQFALEEASRLERETTALTGREQLTIATYNVLNLDPNDADGDADIADGQFEAIAAHIADNLQTPDIIALQEIQDNDGAVAPDESDVTAADETLSLLVEQIEEISDITYKFIDNPFIGDDTNGGQPGGNIRNAFLYNPERVEFVEDSLTTITAPQEQQTNPENPFFDSRLPLVATFTFNDEDITLINNHFSSKGGSSPLFGSIQPATELQEDPLVNGGVEERRSQAEAVATFVENLGAQNPDANIAVLGDLNEFEFISPLEILEAASLTNLTKTLPPNERYSYIFQGNSQSLDHILVSDNLAERAEFDAVHVNSEFSDRASDHDPLVARLQLKPAAPEIVFGTLNDDVFDAAVEDGFDGSADLVFAGAGDDLIDATAGSGNNRLYGGTGDDIFLLGANDRVVGGAGKDRFFVLAGGGNLLTGGADADQFWIASEQPEASNTITDFDPEVDSIGIGGLGVSFSDLSLVQAKNNTLISSPEGDLAVLKGIQSE